MGGNATWVHVMGHDDVGTRREYTSWAHIVVLGGGRCRWRVPKVRPPRTAPGYTEQGSWVVVVAVVAVVARSCLSQMPHSL